MSRMTVLSQLWLPTLLAAVLVFVASSLIHMLTPWHRSDFKTLPDQEKARAAIGSLAIPAGDYVLPRPESMKDMGSPEFLAKVNQGPRLVATVLPNGPTNMGKMMAMWFLYSVAISGCSGYLARCVLGVGAGYPSVFHTAGAAAFLGYSGALAQLSIWYGRSWVTTIKSMIDGLLYAGLIGGTFGWLWPK
jgi:hypothetical protein